MTPVNDKWRNLFGSEWPHIFKLSRCFSDPDQQQAFLDSAKDKKLADPGYSIYSDYPTSENATVRARQECCDFVKSLRNLKEEESA